MTGNGQKPWRRLPDETIEAYLAFCIFLNLGSQRSLHKVAQEIDGKTIIHFHGYHIRLENMSICMLDNKFNCDLLFIDKKNSDSRGNQ